MFSFGQNPVSASQPVPIFSGLLFEPTPKSEQSVDISSTMELGDWQSRKSFADTNLYMLEKEIGCDITFKVGTKEEEVKAHKFILISRSCVFYAMLAGPLAETSDNIVIPDIEKETALLTIRYLYSDKIALTADNVMAVLYAAKKYCIQGLVKKCSEYLRQNMSTGNVCTILDQASVFSEDHLKKNCLTFIFKHGNEVLESDGFLELNPGLFREVIMSDLLIAAEENVYKACLSWSAAECKRRDLALTSENQREVLGSNIYLIRFPVMSLDFFTDTVANEQLLTAEEKVHLFQYLIKKDTDKETKFIKKRRFSSMQFSFNGQALYGRSSSNGFHLGV